LAPRRQGEWRRAFITYEPQSFLSSSPPSLSRISLARAEQSTAAAALEPAQPRPCRSLRALALAGARHRPPTPHRHRGRASPAPVSAALPRFLGRGHRAPPRAGPCAPAGPVPPPAAPTLRAPRRAVPAPCPPCSDRAMATLRPRRAVLRRLRPASPNWLPVPGLA